MEQLNNVLLLQGFLISTREIRSGDRKNLLPERLVQRWNSLPGQVVKLLPLEVIEKQVGQEPIRNDIDVSDLLFGYRKGRNGFLRSPLCNF